MPASSKQPRPQTFEFTKRKRWCETLFSELAETIIFVLSPTCKVLFCGAAIVGLLGWKEDQLVDADLSDFVEDEDRDNFRWSFAESLRTRQEMFIYTRFKYEHPPQGDPDTKQGQLFELKGHPHYVEDQAEPQCFFLTAMPYPSPNIAMLDSFLDTRMENERLAQRISELKSLEASSRSLELQSPSTPHYPMPPYPCFDDPSLLASSSYSRTGPVLPYYTNPDASAASIPGGHNDLLSNGEVTAPPTVEADDDENGHRRKKLKKGLIGDEQRVCVTCGRTDSPEWRKGPLGPKTLCNACGLRWAKQSRKPESDSSPVPGSSFKDQDPGLDDNSYLAGVQQPPF